MESNLTYNDKIETEDELRSLIGYPSQLVQRKVISYLDEHCCDFIARSPFLVISTADDSGFCDVSPRGDKPGFALVLDERHIVIPERPGNRRVDTLCNIVSNPKVGLLFLIPGLGETLRVNGKAALVKDDPLLAKMAVKGKRPLMGICVAVEECFIHCAKAMKRSRIWEPHTWSDKAKLPNAAKILADHVKLPDLTAKDIEKSLQEDYENELY